MNQAFSPTASYLAQIPWSYSVSPAKIKALYFLFQFVSHRLSKRLFRLDQTKKNHFPVFCLQKIRATIQWFITCYYYTPRYCTWTLHSTAVAGLALHEFTDSFLSSLIFKPLQHLAAMSLTLQLLRLWKNILFHLICSPVISCVPLVPVLWEIVNNLSYLPSLRLLKK